ncbi:MAG: HAMP domain-containing histidine kinase [Saccharofermentans sp.]|nr:HAMP domain-containing histidine kinase [Saccharofermentans sp.]
MQLIVIIALSILLILALIKIRYLRKGYDELTENIKDQVSGKTGVPVTLSTSDPKARRCAEALNRELKILNEEKVRFEGGNQTVKDAVTGISHDLRTPLTAIKSYLEMIEEEPDEELRKEYLARIKNRTDALSDLTEELFKYTTSSDRSDAVSHEDIEDQDIRRILEECLISFYASFGKKGIEPKITMPEAAVLARCSRKDANRIFENMIGNALKYSEGDLTIVLTSDAKVTFENPAPSLTPLTVSKLFDKYYTVNDAEGSTGLGFSIAKELIERNGGSIEASLTGTDLRIELNFAR